ncbi:MAG: hypothetical protein QNJ73_13620, partial [Gammaproteobacteria bacterium]|nr:hypothetical protein [Gammaproteobacteria bacterium]
MNRSRLFAIHAIVLLLGASLALPAQAQIDCDDVAASGNWSDAANWTGCGGSFPNNNGGTFNATKDDSGTFTLTENITIEDFTFFGGGVTGAFTINVNGVLNFQGGSMSNAAVIAGGNATLGGIGFQDISGTTLTLNGTTTWSNMNSNNQGRIRTGSGASIVNNALFQDQNQFNNIIS